ncbi:noelin isoform X1 [Corvus kubaryi]|uniref:noelin isoform X1 n=1 Tax=Corvus kubaryi TaxID=68294 RepID=UPI001C03B0E4|nr:noelin isoform X1 [Corvus kubaryi]
MRREQGQGRQVWFLLRAEDVLSWQEVTIGGVGDALTAHGAGDNRGPAGVPQPAGLCGRGAALAGGTAGNCSGSSSPLCPRWVPAVSPLCPRWVPAVSPLGPRWVPAVSPLCPRWVPAGSSRPPRDPGPQHRPQPPGGATAPQRGSRAPPKTPSTSPNPFHLPKPLPPPQTPSTSSPNPFHLPQTPSTTPNPFHLPKPLPPPQTPSTSPKPLPPPPQTPSTTSPKSLPPPPNPFYLLPKPLPPPPQNPFRLLSNSFPLSSFLSPHPIYPSLQIFFSLPSFSPFPKSFPVSPNLSPFPRPFCLCSVPNSFSSNIFSPNLSFPILFPLCKPSLPILLPKSFLPISFFFSPSLHSPVPKSFLPIFLVFFPSLPFPQISSPQIFYPQISYLLIFSPHIFSSLHPSTPLPPNLFSHSLLPNPFLPSLPALPHPQTSLPLPPSPTAVSSAGWALPPGAGPPRSRLLQPLAPAGARPAAAGAGSQPRSVRLRAQRAQQRQQQQRRAGRRGGGGGRWAGGERRRRPGGWRSPNPAAWSPAPVQNEGCLPPPPRRHVCAFTQDWSRPQHHGHDHQLDVADAALPRGAQHHQTHGGHGRHLGPQHRSVAYQPRGKLAGVQLCPGQRGTLYMHSGGTSADDVLA